jgi:hypothetical protein
MKLPVALQLAVLVCLLFAAVLCLRFHKPGDFSHLENLELYAQGIAKLEAEPPFASKENVIAVVRTLVESEKSSRTALRSTATLIEELGYFLLFLVGLQSAGIFYSLRSTEKSERLG